MSIRRTTLSRVGAAVAAGGAVLAIAGFAAPAILGTSPAAAAADPGGGSLINREIFTVPQTVFASGDWGDGLNFTLDTTPVETADWDMNMMRYWLGRGPEGSAEFLTSGFIEEPIPRVITVDNDGYWAALPDLAPSSTLPAGTYYQLNYTYVLVTPPSAPQRDVVKYTGSVPLTILPAGTPLGDPMPVSVIGSVPQDGTANGDSSTGTAATTSATPSNGSGQLDDRPTSHNASNSTIQQSPPAATVTPELASTGSGASALAAVGGIGLVVIGLGISVLGRRRDASLEKL